ncbi:hypothetical protein A2454_02760 [Candidatus Peribacteria bacterium RIFOXYC2_FULL_55_14]|nr:MAG: hypothetical protein A2384_04085 [Candidatus Peribacteria bacterium RIFOXYB1_FULL_54_35]OGJ74857.1 MAG: hypothetical protein A2217_02555 [Candidatus Peribacteria bacterium RIFOXYA2_FULL_55_28]OGJ77145.1 MAG: hypothetical protein A2327_05660 [Candidatus Peribacteria bacterium RIFOXYB2_FULL_54_17]OGJ78579.1 MAG: hypothetical protein A2424_06650 [Candidatus Peribacteria bacterium RIFOXYC1_FULL_54_13]OGJ79799.1 MAG: hypothetical protein A2454_02760 [Candidatus Peribacteria bacterium RIFOXYC
MKADRQQMLRFPDEPLNHRALRVPPFRRPDDPEREQKYKGISPREAFGLASELLAFGMSEEAIAPYLVQFVQRERWAIEHLLKQMENGMAIDALQQENACAMHALMGELTALETAWHLYELNASPLREREIRTLSGNCVILLQGLHRRLGRFRRAVPALHAERCSAATLS